MNDIGNSDLETYIYNLISEGFGLQSNDASSSAEQPHEGNQVELSPVLMQSQNSQKVKGSDVSS